MVIVSNPKHALFNKKGKIQSLEIFASTNEDEVPVLIEEEVVFINKNDITDLSAPKKIVVPKSRKDFYSFIQEEKTTRSDICSVIELMVSTTDKETKEKMIIFVEKEDSQYTKEILCSFVMNSETKFEIVDEIRSNRDKGLIQLNLPNNSFNPKFKKKQTSS